MSDRPITPTRIIPAGAPLPDRPPAPDDIPPWRAPAAPPPAPPPVAMPWPEPPPPGPLQIHVTFLPAEEPPEPTRGERLWAWVTSIAKPWKIVLALLAALLPIPGVGYSAAGVWAYTAGLARTEVGIPWAYALTGVPLLLAGRLLHRTRALRFLVAAVIALIGLLFGALSPFDLVTITTGVSR
ncbi:hypothetical protein PUR59_04235 [Streptomyces sp. SP18ES09]|uniref:hypothetical protein n=1 Tax=Streptomyces sp. SP18ES09 TaxID=3002532 RepID=UPI002E78B47D|nr:hypothetical protein [Streptomyces sp. SP18ES09]MEE1814229.1 hypothetical protein [Streptomyces sp. SP18ES09]